MTWLFLAILCYVLFAINSLGDKFLLSGTQLKNPLTYAIFIGLAGVLVLVAIPFLGFPISSSLASFNLALASGISFVVALLPFFYGLKKHQATSIVPTVGAMQPIFALVIGAMLFSAQISFSVPLFVVLCLLIIGGLFVTVEKRGVLSKEALGLGILSGFFFALSFVLAKQVYLYESLWYGIFWSRAGGSLAAIALFCGSRSARQEIFAKPSSGSSRSLISKAQASALFVLTQLIGAVAGILQQAAIYTAPVFAVAIVNALQGTQYAFIFALSFFASRQFPKVFKEDYTAKGLSYKAAGILFIIAGIILLVYYV